VALAAGTELDETLRIEVGERHRSRVALHDDIVEPCPTTLDEPPRLAVRCGEPGAREQFKGQDAAFERTARTETSGNSPPAPAASNTSRAVSAAASAARQING